MISRKYRIVCLAILHLVVFAAAYCASILVRFDLTFPPDQVELMLQDALWFLLIKLSCFYYLRAFHGWWRYVTFADLADLLKAATLSTLIIAAIDYFVIPGSQIPRGVLAIDWGMTVLLLGGLRSGQRLFREHFLPLVDGGAHRRALIVGATRAGEELVRALRAEPKWGYRAVGFVDEDPAHYGKRLSGIPILGTPRSIGLIAKSVGADDVLVAAESLPGDTMRHLTDECRKCNLRLRIMPSTDELVRGVFRPHGRPVEINDLLKRDAVVLDDSLIESLLSGKRVLITGAGGSIGSEICRQLVTFRPRALALLDRYENNLFLIDRELKSSTTSVTWKPYVADILDEVRMQEIFDEFRPDVVFHAAAHKHVPMMEVNAGEAIKNNVFGTQIVADLALKHSCSHMILISTDKAVNPTSVMGVAKNVAERYVHTLNSISDTQFVVVRFGNVLGSAGSVVPIFQEQIQRGGPVTITHPDMERYFMTIPEASQLVLQAAAMGHAGEIFVLDMGKPVKIVDLVNDMLYLSGLRPGDIEVRYTGIRPGEKLFEELRFDDEQVLPTSHQKIRVAYQRPYDIADVRVMMEAFKNAIGSETKLFELMKLYVPEYGNGVDRSADTAAENGKSNTDSHVEFAVG